MIYVIASIKVKSESLDAFLEIFKANVPAVKAEEGCIEYVPTGDVDAGLTPQVLDPTVVTIMEKWQSLEALHAHLAAPHMLAYQKRVKDMVVGVSLKVLKEG
ncbi:MAG: putative quinol monooxygenase [Candidatus Latescibacterota bacterium]